MSQFRLLPAALIAAALSVAPLTPGVSARQVESTTATPVQTAPALAAVSDRLDDQALEHAESLSRAFRAVSRELAPTVVQVTSFERVTGDAGNEMRRFFGGRAPDRSRTGEGSGVIVSADGYIVTNHHVTAGADEVEVRTRDGREYPAAIIGLDSESDLAVLKIEARDLTYASFGDSSVVEPGQWVLAIGNPYRFDHTVTAGIVSAVRRSNVGLAVFENFIQTDAAINPGNSGGPLVNLRGEIIGINTAISTRTGGYSGLGFAIPSNMVRSVFESIRESGRVVRGWLGVQIQPLTPMLADSFGFDGSGVLIADVLADGPALRAGMQPGDIVIQVGNRRVEATADLLNAVAETRPGSRTAIKIFRDRRFDELSVRLGERQIGPRQTERRPPPPPEIRRQSDLGLDVETLTPDVAGEIGAESDRGVVIVDVASGSLAAQSGLFPGDIIVRVADREVVDADDFEDIMDGWNPGDPVRLLVWTRRGGGRHLFVMLQAGV